MLQDLYLRFPRGLRFSSLNLAARLMVKCCRIYTWGPPPADVSPAWTWPRDTWWNAAGSIPEVPPPADVSPAWTWPRDTWWSAAGPIPQVPPWLVGRETHGEMLQDLYLRFPRGWLAARHVVKCCRIYTWSCPPAGVSPAWTWSRGTWQNAAGSIPEVPPRLTFLQPKLGRKTRGEMLQDLYLRLPCGCWPQDTWWNAAGSIPEVPPWLVGRKTRGEMLQDLYLKLPPGWHFSSLNLASRHVAKCCRIYNGGYPPADVSPAWTWLRDTWWNAAGSIPQVAPWLVGHKTHGEMLQDLYLRFPHGWLATRHVVKCCKIYTWSCPPAGVFPAWTWLRDT